MDMSGPKPTRLLGDQEGLPKSINAIHPLRFLFGVYEAAESGSELLSARPMRHATQTGTIPIYFASLFIESSFLRGFFFRFFQSGRKWVARGIYRGFGGYG